MSAKGAIATYRWRVSPGAESAFEALWHDVTLDIRENYGGLGSCLTQDANGVYVGFALWPSKAARDVAWQRRGEIAPDPKIELLSEEWFDIVDDLWLRSSFR